MRLSSNYIYMIEAGKVLPSPKVLTRFAVEFGFNLNLLRVYLYHDKVRRFKKETQEKLGLASNFPL